MENETQAEQVEQKPVPQLTLQLDLNEVNVVLTSLGKEPFNNVAALIGKIREQGIVQLKEQAAGAAA
jgi:hypothetical protein